MPFASPPVCGQRNVLPVITLLPKLSQPLPSHAMARMVFLFFAQNR